MNKATFSSNIDLYLNKAIDKMEKYKIANFIDFLKSEADENRKNSESNQLIFVKDYKYTSFKFYQIRPKKSNKIIIKTSYSLYENQIYNRYQFDDNLNSYIETFSLCSWNTRTTKSHLKLFNVIVENKNYSPHFLDNKISSFDTYIITRNRKNYFNYNEMVEYLKNRNDEDVAEEITNSFSVNQLNILRCLAS